jgi:hypothetical protein
MVEDALHRGGADRARDRAASKEANMPARVEVPIVIDRPIADVWRFYALEHVRNHPRWDPQMHLEQVSEGPIGLGTVIRRRNTHFDTPVEGTMEVVEFEAERAMGVEIHDGDSETHGRVTFAAAGPTRTTLTIRAEFLDLDASMEAQITPMVERSARNIKRLIEDEVPAQRAA